MTLPKLSIYSKALILISIILIIGIPFANRYIPYTDTFGKFTDVWSVDPESDPYYKYRLTIIKIGFILTALALLNLIVSLFAKGYGFTSKLLDTVLFLFVFSLGTKNYPYWANGLFYAFREGGESSAYDPKAILPMTEFGETWREIIGYFYLVCIIAIPFLIVRQIILLSRKKGDSSLNLFIIYATAVLVLSFFFTPNYIGWLAD